MSVPSPKSTTSLGRTCHKTRTRCGRCQRLRGLQVRTMGRVRLRRYPQRRNSCQTQVA